MPIFGWISRFTLWILLISRGLIWLSMQFGFRQLALVPFGRVRGFPYLVRGLRGSRGFRFFERLTLMRSWEGYSLQPVSQSQSQFIWQQQ